jgi:predicted TIM-barrel fold metal-dependent hydrolase
MSTARNERTLVDERFYAQRLENFLPRRIIDIHAHIWRTADYPKQRAPELRSVTWPARVAADCTIESLQATYASLLPGKSVTPLIFPNQPDRGNLARINRYVAACSRRAHVPALVWSDPAWDARELERQVRTGGFAGAKSYLGMVPPHIPTKEIRIFDFFPPHQLEVHDRHGWVVMLHIPRDGRLKDPVNLAQMLEIEKAYPRAKIIIAHVGRAYCDGDVGNAFEVLAPTRRLLFDFSANTNARVFEQLIRCVGPKRILFGSDMPITRMRMRRVMRDGHYVNLVPKGLYGDVSGDKNMGEVEGAAAARLTTFLYEELDAFRRAALRTCLTAADIRGVFHDNAARILRAAGWK